MLSQQLKENTNVVHQESERKMIQQLRRIRTSEDYVLFLNRLYGYYRPLEDLLLPWLTRDLLPDIDKRIRASYLLWDIQELEKGPLVPELCEELPRIGSFARALGALYVLEGSTLGGRIIAEMLARQLGSFKSLSFFNSYGKETGKMWLTFKTYLNRPYREEEKEDILSAATDTFITFKNWIEKYELHPQL